EDGQLKPLNQAVIAAARESLLEIGIERTGLNPTNDGDARRLDAQGAAAQSIVDITAATIPRFAIEGPVIFMTGPVHAAEQSAQLITEEEQAVGILIEELPEFLDGGVVDDIAPLGGDGRLRHIEGVAELVGGLMMFQGLAQAPGEGLLAGPIFSVAEAMHGALLLVSDPCIGHERMQRLERLGEGSAFHEAGAADGETPEIGDD